jgi:Sulfotransferase domain
MQRVERPTPTFLIIGAPKCGTTSLAYWLMDHPEVHMPPEKELYFFDAEFERGPDWYRARLNGTGSRAVGEATPAYLATAEAPERIASFVPQTRLIALLRDPVDRAYSHYQHWAQEKQEHRNFAEVVEFELSRPPIDEARVWDPNQPEPYSYLAFGRYHRQLQRYLRHFSREQLLVLLLEDLRDDPVGAWQQVCRHIAVDPDVVPDSVGEAFFSYRSYRPWWLWSMIQRIRLGERVPKKLGGLMWRAMVREGDSYPPMRPEQRARLAEHYAQDNAELAAFLGRNLGHWGQTPALTASGR